MSTGELPEEAPGTYVPYGKRAYYLPETLPPEIDIEPGLRERLQDALYHLGRLEGIGDETDASPLLYTTLVRREAVESVVLEGAEIEFEDVFRAGSSVDQTVRKDVQEALNYERAIREGARAVAESGEITLELLTDLHAVLMDGVRGNCEFPGEFRPKPMNLPAAASYQEPFVPPAPDRIPALMTDLERYIGTGGAYHDLVDLGVVHYQFETIHPFEDGNGRLGRILITLQLVQDGYLTDPYLYPSAYFNRNKIEYARRMRTVSEQGEWNAWLRFFIDGIRTQAEEAVERTEELRDLRRQYEREYGHGKTAADRLAMRLFERPYVTTNDAAALLDVTAETARTAIRQLESEGILEETTGKERYQEFRAVEIFDILDEPVD
jgi:Fic family protein